MGVFKGIARFVTKFAFPSFHIVYIFCKSEFNTDPRKYDFNCLDYAGVRAFGLRSHLVAVLRCAPTGDLRSGLAHGFLTGGAVRSGGV